MAAVGFVRRPQSANSGSRASRSGAAPVPRTAQSKRRPGSASSSVAEPVGRRPDSACSSVAEPVRPASGEGGRPGSGWSAARGSLASYEDWPIDIPECNDDCFSQDLTAWCKDLAAPTLSNPHGKRPNWSPASCTSTQTPASLSSRPITPASACDATGFVSSTSLNDGLGAAGSAMAAAQSVRGRTRPSTAEERFRVQQHQAVPWTSVQPPPQRPSSSSTYARPLPGRTFAVSFPCTQQHGAAEITHQFVAKGSASSAGAGQGCTPESYSEASVPVDPPFEIDDRRTQRSAFCRESWCADEVTHGEESHEVKCPTELDSVAHAVLAELSLHRAIWQPQRWLEAQDEINRKRQLALVVPLLQRVRYFTDHAITAGCYHIAPASKIGAAFAYDLDNHMVDLSKFMRFDPRVDWLGRDVRQPALGSSFHESPPPFIFNEECSLDLAIKLRRDRNAVSSQVPIVLVAEIKSFDVNGDIDLGNKNSIFPNDLLLRTNISTFFKAAAGRHNKNTVKYHLTSAEDPYIFRCENVTIFRGPREGGYAFLETPIQVHILVMALSNYNPLKRDVVMRKTGSSSWYQNLPDQVSLIDRLELVGEFVNFHPAGDEVENPQLPILLMSPPGCSAGYEQPDAALANTLKHWRRQFGIRFHAVYISCWDEGGNSISMRYLAQYLERIVNRNARLVAKRREIDPHLLAVKLAACTAEGAARGKSMHDAIHIVNAIATPPSEYGDDVDERTLHQNDFEFMGAFTGVLASSTGVDGTSPSERLTVKQSRQTAQQLMTGALVGFTQGASTFEFNVNRPETTKRCSKAHRKKKSVPRPSSDPPKYSIQLEAPAAIQEEDGEESSCGDAQDYDSELLRRDSDGMSAPPTPTGSRPISNLLLAPPDNSALQAVQHRLTSPSPMKEKKHSEAIPFTKCATEQTGLNIKLQLHKDWENEMNERVEEMRALAAARLKFKADAHSIAQKIDSLMFQKMGRQSSCINRVAGSMSMNTHNMAWSSGYEQGLERKKEFRHQLSVMDRHVSVNGRPSIRRVRIESTGGKTKVITDETLEARRRLREKLAVAKKEKKEKHRGVWDSATRMKFEASTKELAAQFASRHSTWTDTKQAMVFMREREKALAARS